MALNLKLDHQQKQKLMLERMKYLESFELHFQFQYL